MGGRFRGVPLPGDGSSVKNAGRDCTLERSPRLARERRAPNEVNLSITVHGSTSNLGCGFDCLGLAVERAVTLEVEPAEDPKAPLRLFEARGTLNERPLEGEERIVRAMEALARKVGRQLPAVVLRAQSTIPVARGIGSSGAATVAGLVAANTLLDFPLTDDGLFDLGCALEDHPDNVGPALFGGCVVAMPDAAARVRWYPARVHGDLRVALAAPKTRVETTRARAVLPTTVPFALARDHARKLAQLLRGLEDLDPIRLLLGMSDELHTPHRLPLIPGGAEAMEAAREAGALAAAISGSGSAIVALGRGDLSRAADAMKKAFTKVGEEADAFVSAIPRAGYQLRRT